MSKLLESNQKTLKKIVETNEEFVGMKEAMKHRWGKDITSETDFPVMQESFSWKGLKQKLSLREADVASAFTQFLRAGVQTIANNAYLSHKTTYEEWVKVVQSSKDTEIYAPNHGVSFPNQVGPNERFPEVGAAALNLKLQNRKFGSIYAITKELLNDDQSGSFQAQSAKLGEYMKLINEVLCYGKLASVANMQYINYQIPVSETKPSYETSYPWAPVATPLRGGGITRAATFTLPTKAAVQAAKVGLMNQKNLQGIKMNVTGNRIIAGPALEFDLSILLNSAYYPSGAAAAGATGGAFAINPLKGIANLTISPYVFKNDGTVNGDSLAWYMTDDTKPGFLLQLRENLLLEQEAINSGDSFNYDLIRWKASSRMNADFLDPRFFWQGNDGSVVS